MKNDVEKKLRNELLYMTEIIEKNPKFLFYLYMYICISLQKISRFISIEYSTDNI